MRRTNTIKKIVSIILLITMLFTMTACSFSPKQVVDDAKKSITELESKAESKAKEITDDVNDIYNDTKDKIVNWYSKIDFGKFKKGWDYAIDFMGSTYAAVDTSAYVDTVAEAINTLKTDINKSAMSARGTAQEAGLVAERWVADTFNIDSALKKSSYKAKVVGSNELGSPDVKIVNGKGKQVEAASLKYYQSANGSASAQAQTILQRYNKYAYKSPNPKSIEEWLNSEGYSKSEQKDILESIYKGQTRIIPADQLQTAKEYLQGKIDFAKLKASGKSATNIKAYTETLKNLKDRLKAKDGTKSKPATYEEMQAIAELAKTGEFEPKDFGLSLSQVLTSNYVVKQAMGTGIDAALLDAAFTVGPDVFSIIKEAIEKGKIDKKQIKKVGIEGAIAGGEGFVEGSVSSIVVSLCKLGYLGKGLINVNPTVVASLVVFLIESVINGYHLATGDITKEEYANLMVDKFFIGLMALPPALVLMYLEAPKLLMIAGCLAGGMLASVVYYKLKDYTLEMVDAGGFESFMPVKKAKSFFAVAKEKIAALNIKEKVSNFKDSIISTTDGLIHIKVGAT